MSGGSASVVTNRSALAKHLWLIQGYAQDMLLGDPDAVVTAKQSVRPELVDVPNDEKLVDLLKQVVVHAETPSAQAFPWALLLPVLKAVLSELLPLILSA
jgi:hypothetical protein